MLIKVAGKDVKVQAKRVHAGVYTYSLAGYTVRVEDRDPNPAFGDTKVMWCAIPAWESNWGAMSDPMETKREAVEIARTMLANVIPGASL